MLQSQPPLATQCTLGPGPAFVPLSGMQHYCPSWNNWRLSELYRTFWLLGTLESTTGRLKGWTRSLQLHPSSASTHLTHEIPLTKRLHALKHKCVKTNDLSSNTFPVQLRKSRHSQRETSAWPRPQVTEPKLARHWSPWALLFAHNSSSQRCTRNASSKITQEAVKMQTLAQLRCLENLRISGLEPQVILMQWKF